jgi:hypothetical protein
MDSLQRLSAAIDGLTADGLESADLPTRMRALHRAVARLHAKVLRTTAAFDAGGDWEIDGTTSAASWIRHAVRLRRLLAARDGGCRFPGCDRPLAWCDAHHVIPWSAGGPTDQGNLAMLCRRHHRAVHEGGFRLTLTGGEVSVWRPDGAPLALRERPPPWTARAG